QEDSADRYDEDIEENDRPAAEEVEAATAPKDALPAKRGRGRPKGSKNKKSGAASATAGPSEGAPVKKKRGRPPKEKKPDDSGAEEPPAKRRRGRPRKEQKSQQTITAGTSATATGDGSGESIVKKKRGRPPKKT
ncbi:hypothetical protein L210DRAFT_3526789, partial [Boletus edulis BED1]